MRVVLEWDILASPEKRCLPEAKPTVTIIPKKKCNMLQNCNKGKSINMMNEKRPPKTTKKPSMVHRIKTKHENFYKNQIGKGNLEYGLNKGMKILKTIVGDQNAFNQIVMKKYDELMDIMALKYGHEFIDECYFNLGTFLNSALNNGGKGEIRELKLLIKYLEEHKE